MSADPTAVIASLGLEPMYSAQEAAEMLGRSYSWLDQRLRAGQFVLPDGTPVQPLRTPGGYRRFTLQMLRDIVVASARRDGYRQRTRDSPHAVITASYSETGETRSQAQRVALRHLGAAPSLDLRGASPPRGGFRRVRPVWCLSGLFAVSGDGPGVQARRFSRVRLPAPGAAPWPPSRISSPMVGLSPRNHLGHHAFRRDRPAVLAHLGTTCGFVALSTQLNKRPDSLVSIEKVESF